MKKPTLEQATEYAQEKGYTFDVEYFINYHESRGWLIGKKHCQVPMKSWKAAMFTFQRNQDNWNKDDKKPAAQKIYTPKPQEKYTDRQSAKNNLSRILHGG